MKYFIIFFSCLVTSFRVVGQKAALIKNAGAICDSTQFNYTGVSSVSPSLPTTFRWSRAVIPGIANPAAMGNTNLISEFLDNTTANSVLVKYAITLTSNGCDHTDTLQVIVHPTPRLSSTLTPSAICDSTAFIYTATSLTPGTTFSWLRPAVAGIANISAAGSGNMINEVLVNNTNADITVKYGIRMVANSCIKTDTISVVVHPTPFLVKNNISKKIFNTTVISLQQRVVFKKKEEMELVYL